MIEKKIGFIVGALSWITIRIFGFTRYYLFAFEPQNLYFSDIFAPDIEETSNVVFDGYETFEVFSGIVSIEILFMILFCWCGLIFCHRKRGSTLKFKNVFIYIFFFILPAAVINFLSDFNATLQLWNSYHSFWINLDSIIVGFKFDLLFLLPFIVFDLLVLMLTVALPYRFLKKNIR